MHLLSSINKPFLVLSSSHPNPLLLSPHTLLPLFPIPPSWLALNMGTGKPEVFPKQVVWVWVRSWILAHHGTLRTYTAVSWVFTGILQMD